MTAEWPRSIKLVEELDIPGGACSIGVSYVRTDRDLLYWDGTIWGPPHGQHENRIYSLKMRAGPNYPKEPPVFIFRSKINLPGVDPNNGLVDNSAIPYLRNWVQDAPRLLRAGQDKISLPKALDEIRTHMDRHKKLPQPPEEATFPLPQELVEEIQKFETMEDEAKRSEG